MIANFFIIWFAAGFIAAIMFQFIPKLREHTLASARKFKQEFLKEKPEAHTVLFIIEPLVINGLAFVRIIMGVFSLCESFDILTNIHVRGKTRIAIVLAITVLVILLSGCSSDVEPIYTGESVKKGIKTTVEINPNTLRLLLMERKGETWLKVDSIDSLDSLVYDGYDSTGQVLRKSFVTAFKGGKPICTIHIKSRKLFYKNLK